MFQHYVPRVYLAGFTDPDTPSGQEPWLWVWDKTEDSVKRRAPTNVAGATDYYEDVENFAGPGAGLESRLANVEGRVAGQLKRLQVAGARLAQVDRDLAWFLATLSVRAPWAKRAIFEHIERHGSSRVLERLEPREQWASSVEYLATWVAEYLGRMEWVLCGPSDDESVFVTSDRPVVLSGTNLRGSALDVLRLAERCAVVTVPLTSRLALVGTYDRVVLMRNGITTHGINQRTIECAERLVFSPRNPR